MAKKRKSSRLLKRVRYLTFALLASAVVNVAVLGVSWYRNNREYEVVNFADPVESVQEEAPLSVAAALPPYQSLTYDQLVAKLASRRRLGDGYSERDLALATLVALHDFDIKRALGGNPVEKRIIRLQGQKPGQLSAIALFPGLSENELTQVSQFAKEEAWPLTSRGLFRRLKKDPPDSLVAAFTLTTEFHRVEQLFPHCHKEELIALVQSGSWQMLASLPNDPSLHERRKYLLSYVAHGSPVAADLMIRMDRAYATDMLDDRILISVVSRLRNPSAEIRSFLIDLLVSPRSNAVWVATAERLYAFSGETMPQPYNHIEALTRFVPENMLRERVEMSKPAKRPRPITTHEVQPGESLWTIARDYNTTVAALRETNSLTGDLIRHGQKLIIPQDHAHHETTAHSESLS